MARALHKLPPKALMPLTEPGFYGDGGGLYLVIPKSGSSNWVYRYR